MISIIKYLHLRDVGFLEMILALYPILTAYSRGPLLFSLLVLLILDIYVFLRRNIKILKHTKLFVLFLIFIILHDSILIPFASDWNAPFNMLVGIIIYIISIIIVVPVIDFHKFKGAINWVAIISLLGMIYHYIMILAGKITTPLKIPFLQFFAEQTRLSWEIDRPTSFYAEPPSYVSFMIVPLAIALYEKKYIWAAIIILSLFLSTSTTGLIIPFVMLFVYVFTQKVAVVYKLFTFLLSVMLVFVLLHSKFFEYGVDKLTNTSLDTDIRLYQGREMILNMDKDYWLLGSPYLNPFQYFQSEGTRGVDVIVYEGGGVFVPTFWLLILRFGIIGLFFYITIYYKIGKHKRDVWPYLSCVLVTMFSNPDFLGASYFFSSVFICIFPNLKYLTNEKNNSTFRRRIG